MLIIAINTKILFHQLVHTFRLTVSLRVKGCRQSTMDARAGARDGKKREVKIEPRSETRESRMPWSRMTCSRNKLAKSKVSVVVGARNKMRHLSESVNNGQHSTETARYWE